MPPKSRKSFRVESDDPDSDDSQDEVPRKKRKHDGENPEYRNRRQRNNIAVRKSRDKSRMKAKEMMEKVNRLKTENTQLEQKVEILSKELSILKDLFLAHAGTVAAGECMATGDCNGMHADMMMLPVNADALSRDHEYSCTIKVEK